jgi:hypothetical protein
MGGKVGAGAPLEGRESGGRPGSVRLRGDPSDTDAAAPQCQAPSNLGARYVPTEGARSTFSPRDGSEFQVFIPVPPGAESLLVDGSELPAKRLPLEPNVLTIDWPAARAENPSLSLA